MDSSEDEKNIIFFGGICLLFACSDNANFLEDSGILQKTEINSYEAIREVRSYIRLNEEALLFMQNRSIHFTDLKYGLTRQYNNEKGFFLEIPVIRGMLFSNKRENWVKGEETRMAVLIQFDNKDKIVNINYIQQIPTKEYYKKNARNLYFDKLIGKEDVYDKDDRYVGNFNKKTSLTRMSWTPDSNGVYPGDSIPEVVIPGHTDGGGDELFPENPEIDDIGNDTIADITEHCPQCGCYLNYDGDTNTYYCPICQGNPVVGGGGMGGGGGSSGNVNNPQTNPNIKTGFSISGYLSNYKQYAKINQLPVGVKVRLFNPKLHIDQNMFFVKRTPQVVIGQSDAGCVPACINHLLLSFGQSVVDEYSIWKTYYNNIYKCYNPSGYPFNDVVANGVNDIYVEELLKRYFDILPVEDVNGIKTAIDRGNPIFLIYLKDENGDVAQSHAEVLYGYGDGVLVLFDASCQDFVVWDAQELNDKILFVYEIKGRR